MLQKRMPDRTLAPAAPYIIRGVNWSPASRSTNTTPTDPNNANVRRPAFGTWYQTDIPLMAAMNVNTVRLFIDPGFDATLGPMGLNILDAFYARGIMVIMTVDDAINNTSRAQQVVNFYKNHPAILMWSLGSEWNINRYFGVASSVPDAANRTETAATLIKKLDNNHPIASSYGEIDFGGPGSDTALAATQNYVNNVSKSVDVWSVNIYRGDNFGTLFQQWASITTKPMFLGEFGIDAFHTTAPQVTPAPGQVNELEQAQWDVSLWQHIRRNLSAIKASKVALGGVVFEWADEWWKVPPAGSQETGGWLSGGFPDGMGNEEYFGIVNIDRVRRQVYNALTSAFDPAYSPSEQVTLTAISTGSVANNSCGPAEFRRGATLLYRQFGCRVNGGRGFNVAVIDQSSGDLIGPIRNFDTWIGGEDAFNTMVAFLSSIPNGAMIMIAVADEAGLTGFATAPPCSRKSGAGIEAGLKALEALGSKQIRNYCYQNSWAMITVKGEGAARTEQLSRMSAVTLQLTITLPPIGLRPFSFQPLLGQFLNTTRTSNPISVAGISAASISIMGGGYSVNGGAYTSSPGTVHEGDSVTVRISSAAAINTQTCAAVTIGGVSATFCVKTGSMPLALPQFLQLLDD